MSVCLSTLRDHISKTRQLRRSHQILMLRLIVAFFDPLLSRSEMVMLSLFLYPKQPTILQTQPNSNQRTDTWTHGPTQLPSKLKQQYLILRWRDNFQREMVAYFQLFGIHETTDNKITESYLNASNFGYNSHFAVANNEACSRWTQSITRSLNQTKLNDTTDVTNPTEPNPWMDPTHAHLWLVTIRSSL